MFDITDSGQPFDVVACSREKEVRAIGTACGSLTVANNDLPTISCLPGLFGS